MKLMSKVSMKWKNWSDSKGLYRMKSLVWTFFQDAEISMQWTIPHFQSTCVIPTSSNSWRNAKPFFWNAKPQKRIAMHLGHTWYIGKRSCNPGASSSALYTQELNPWSSQVSEQMHSSQTGARMRIKHQFRIRDASQDHHPTFQSSSVEETLQRTVGQTNTDCRSQIFISTIPTSTTFVWWKMRFKTEVCTCSQFLAEAVLWIKEVELLASVDDLKSSCGIHMLNSEVLDAKIASVLNRIIHNSHFKKRINLEEQKAQKEDRFLRGSRIAYLIFESTFGSLEPTILSRIMPTYLQLFFEMTIFRNSIQSGTEFYCLWRKSHLMISWKICTC